MKMLIVETGRERFKDRFLKEITSRPHEFFLLINSAPRVVMDNWYQRYIPQTHTISADFRNPTEAAHCVKDWLNAKGIRLSGVTTYVEVAVLVAQAIQNELSLPPITTGNPGALRNKSLMRMQLTEAGLPQPKFIVCQTPNEAVNAVRRIGVPCVFKPSQMGASIGVRKVSTCDEKDITEAFNTAVTEDFAEEDWRYAYDIAPEVLVEEYIPTYQEVSCEGFVESGKLNLVAITKKMLGSEPRFEEIGHITPYPVTIETIAEIKNQLLKIIQALKLYNTTFHAEFRLRKNLNPVLIEIGARLSGGFIPQLVHLSKGVDLLDASLRLAIGQEFNAKSEDLSTAAGRYLLDEESVQRALLAADKIRSLSCVDELAIYSGINKGRRGHIIWTANNFNEVEDVWDTICKVL